MLIEMNTDKKRVGKMRQGDGIVQEQKDLKEQREEWESRMGLPIQISGVLFALDLIFLQNLTQPGGLAGWKLLSLLAFTLALPCLGGNVFIMAQMRRTKTVLQGRARAFGVIQIGGYLASGVGVWASIMGASLLGGFLFLLVATIVVFLCAKALKDLDQRRREEVK
jgi:hypothetical protein